MFKRPATHYGKTAEPETPYQRAGQIWDDRIGSARVQARNWRLMAFGSLFLSAGFAAALVWFLLFGGVQAVRELWRGRRRTRSRRRSASSPRGTRPPL